MSAITSFIKHHYRHFNAAALVDAAEGYNKLLAEGGKMFRHHWRRNEHRGAWAFAG
jgi:hypothetical protein